VGWGAMTIKKDQPKKERKMKKDKKIMGQALSPCVVHICLSYWYRKKRELQNKSSEAMER